MAAEVGRPKQNKELELFSFLKHEMTTILDYKPVRFLFPCHCFREQVHFRKFAAMKHSPELSSCCNGHWALLLGGSFLINLVPD